MTESWQRIVQCQRQSAVETRRRTHQSIDSSRVQGGDGLEVPPNSRIRLVMKTRVMQRLEGGG